jgi:hypothetical protein
VRRYLIGVAIITVIYCLLNAAVFDIARPYLDSVEPHPIINAALLVVSFPLMYLAYCSGLAFHQGGFIACSFVNGVLWGLFLIWAGSSVARRCRGAHRSDHAPPPGGSRAQ